MSIIETKRTSISQAHLYERKSYGSLLKDEVEIYTLDKAGDEKYSCTLPMQVHEILINHQKISNPVLTHCGEESVEVSKSDWIYRMEFCVQSDMNRHLLKCSGLDTIVDVYVNGEKIGSHSNMFYPFEAEIYPKLNESNVLLFHFYSPVKYLESMKALHMQEKHIDPAHYMRKAPHDFEDFLGIKPYFASIGIFEEVVIESMKSGTIDETVINYQLSENLKQAAINIGIKGELLKQEDYHVRCTMEDENGVRVFSYIEELPKEGVYDTQIQTEWLNVNLWWPTNYGKQTLYICNVYLENSDQEVIEASAKQVGFRHIEFRETFDLYVNKKAVKLWGANLVPINGLTHCFDVNRAKNILWLAKNANMNILRFWGGGEPYPDTLYAMADQMGLLIWGEFFHKWGMYPEDEVYMEQYRKEADFMLKSFRHHPALIMWCGGNESQMGAELDFPKEPYIGNAIFDQYEVLCKELDPEKYFQKNSPWKGAFVNDPREGDFHGWNHLWYVPYDKYPVMFSENSRVSPPILKHLKKYIPNGEDLWPEGFRSKRTCFKDNLLPPAWMKLKAGPEPYWCSPVEQFYDAESPEELIYQCQAAHGKLMKQIGERLRRGRPAREEAEKRRCNGQLIWKLNDSWPQIFCSLLDYDLGVGIPYYTVKRVYEPIHVCFDMEDHITIWGVNDSRDGFSGTMEFVLFDPIQNEIIKKFTKNISIRQGESIIICDLDTLTQFKRENVLYACLKDKNGVIIARNYELVEIERNFYFPNAVITLEREDEYLVIYTDQFARCISLEAECEGDVWFEDNYFDLLPFEKRHIKVPNQTKELIIKAKPYYSTTESTITFSQEVTL